MKRILLILSLLAVVGGGGIAYVQHSGTPEETRNRALKKAREYMRQSKVAEAVIEFQNAVEADPRSAGGRYELAMALLKRGEFGRAYQELVRALDLTPDFTKARFQLAILQLLGNDVAAAKEQYEKLRKQDGHSVETRYLAARIALAERDPDRAIGELVEASKKQPKPAGLYVDIGMIYANKKDFEQAEKFYRKALEIDPKLIGAMIALTKLYLDMGDQAKAEQELILATKADPENENLLHILGSYYAGTRKFDEFENLYLNLLNKKPDSLIAKKKLTEIYIRKGDLQRAWAYAQEIEKAQPGDTDASYFYGRLHLAQKEFPRAAELLFNVTRDAPRFAPGYYFLGIARLGSNEIALARTAIAKAKELSPLWREPRAALARLYLAGGDYDLAWAEAEEILRVHPRNLDMLMIGGAARLKKNEIQQALDLFRRAKEVAPGDANSHNNIGTVYLIQKKYSQALNQYEKALEIDPDRIDTLSSIAKVLVVEGNQKAAIARVQRHLAKTKKKAHVYELLGQLSLAARDYEKGFDNLRKAVDLDPNLLTAYALMGQAYAKQKMFDSGIEQYEKIVAKNPEAVPALVMLGTLYDAKKEPAKANEYYKKVLDLNKDVAPAANNLAWNYAEHGGNLDIALRLAQKAREIDPENAGIADTLGWIYYKKGAYSTAANLLRESNENFQNKNPTVLYHLAMAYHKNDETSRARDALKRALTLSQNFPEAEQAKKVFAQLGSNG